MNERSLLTIGRTIARMATLCILLIAATGLWAQVPVEVAVDIPLDATDLAAEHPYVDVPLEEDRPVLCSFGGNFPDLGGCSAAGRGSTVELRITLNSGDDHELAGSSMEATLALKIIIGQPFGLPDQEEHFTLQINAGQPEQVIERRYEMPITDLVVVREDDVPGDGFEYSGMASTDVHFRSVVTLYHRIAPGGAPEMALALHPPAPVSGTSNQVRFSWYQGEANGCFYYPRYQFQLLHVFPEAIWGGVVPPDELFYTTVDWAGALTIEVEAPPLSIDLTIAEGSGFYIWRVRPIGNLHEGGTADPANWGEWTNTSFLSPGLLEPNTFTILACERTDEIGSGTDMALWNTSLGTPAAFYYEQFDEDRNWIYSRTFTEPSPSDGIPIRIGERMTYATQLQQVQQEQVIRSSDGKVLGSQTVYDRSGRAAVQSMPVPLPGQPSLGYAPMLLSTDGITPYNAADFDDDGTPGTRIVNHTVSTAGPYGYYSGTNPDTEVPDAEGYPFSRTLYYPDGRVKQASAPGSTFSFDDPAGIDTKTPITFYAAATQDELASVFGKESYVSGTVHKIRTVDANGVISETFQDKEGKVLATCLLKTDDLQPDDEERILAGLDSELGEAIVANGTLAANSIVNDHIVEAYGTIDIVTAPQTVTFTYTLDPAEITDACSEICATCDYTVELFILNTEDPLTNLVPQDADVPVDPGDPNGPTEEFNFQRFTIPHPLSGSSTCGAPLFTREFNVEFTEPGIYQVERRITTHNMDGDVPFLDEHLADISTYYNTLWTAEGSPRDLLSDPEDGLQDLLEEYQEVEGTSFDIPLACSSMTLPAPDCMACSVSAETMLQYLEDQYNLIPEITPIDLSSSLPSALFAYPESGVPSAHFSRTQFTQLIANMDGDPGHHYPCDILNGCWISAVNTYVTALASGGTTIDFGSLPDLQAVTEGVEIDPSTAEVHLMDLFLDCTGRSLQGWVDQATGTSPSAAVIWGSSTYAEDPAEYGYLTHAYAYMGATADPTLHPCFTAVMADPSFNAAFGSVTDLVDTYVIDGLSQTGWDILYNCLQADGFPHLDIDSPEEALGYYEDKITSMRMQCMAQCEQHRPAFEAEVLQAYANTLDPEDEEDREIIDCLISALVMDCMSDCNGLEVLYNTNEPPLAIGIGPQMAVERIRSILAGYPDVMATEQEGVCETGYHAVDTDGSPAYPPVNIQPTASQIVAQLNTMMNDFARFVFQYDPNLMTTHTYNGWYIDPTSDDQEAICTRTLVGLACAPLRITVRFGIRPDYYYFNNCAALDLGGRTTFSCARTALNFHSIAGFDIDLGTLPLMHFTYVVPGYGAGSQTWIESSTFQNMHDAMESGFEPFTDVKGRFILSGSFIDFEDPTITGPTTVTTADFPVPSNTVPMDCSSTDDPLMNGFAWGCMDGEDPADPPETDTWLDIMKKNEVGCTPGNCRTYHLCLKWVPGVDVSGLGDPHDFTLLDCEDIAQINYLDLVIQHEQAITDGALAEFRQAYNITCADPANIADHLSWSYPKKQHHFTLYYYDRAGNLMRTVPPAGVHPLGGDPEDWTSTLAVHDQPTNYRHNSLGQVVSQETPDGGHTDLYYDLLARLRISQNAKQAASNGFSYTRYDALSRIVEIGESTAIPPGGNFQAAVTSDPTFPTTDRVHRAITVYSERSDGGTLSFWDGRPQRNLMNRVSSTIRDEDGDLNTLYDQVSTFYSYDPHGNVEWMIQQLPDIGRQYIAYDYELVSGRVLQVRYNEGRVDQFFQRYAYDEDGRILRAETSVDGIIWDRDASYGYYAHGPLKRTVIGEDRVQGTDYTYTLRGWLKGINDHQLLADVGQDGTEGSIVARDAFGMMLTYFNGDFTRTGSPFGSDVAQPAADPSKDNVGMDLPLYNGNISAWSYRDMLTKEETGDAPPTHSFLYRYDVLNRLRNSQAQHLTEDIWPSPTGIDVWAPDPALAYNTNYTYDANGNLKTLQRRNGTGGMLDDLGYTYDPGHPNRLLTLEEDTGLPDDGADIIDPHAYQYDGIGQLEEESWNDEASTLHIAWTPFGKVEDVTLASGRHLRFLYDAAGRRVMKADVASADNGFSAPYEPDDRVTYYVTDAQGALLATYERVISEGTEGHDLDDHTRLLEQPIYGSSRLGQRDGDGLEVQHRVWDDGVATLDVPTLLSTNVVDHLESCQITLPQGLQGLGASSWRVRATQPDDANGFPIIGNVPVPAVACENLYRAEENGVTRFTARTGKRRRGRSICVVTDAQGFLLPNSNGIRSDWSKATLGCRVPGSITDDYLFTVGTNGIPYLHVISGPINGKTVTTKNIPLDLAGGYGRGMAVIDDRTALGRSMLYLTHYNATTHKMQLMGMDIEAYAQSGDPIMQLLAEVSTNATGTPKSELQVSPDGRYITFAASGGTNAGFLSLAATRLYVFPLSTDHTQVTGSPVSFQETNAGIRNLDFSPSGRYLYYVSTGPSGPSLPGNPSITGRLRRYDLTAGTSSTVLNRTGDIRRNRQEGGDRMLLLGEQNKYAYSISAPDGTPSTTQHTIIANNTYQKLQPALALQPLLILPPPVTATRTVGRKHYELTDHLGNVRIILTDRKLGEVDAFEPEVTARSDYYPFGMLLPGDRTHSSDAYRFGFNGQEKDDEVFGSVGTSMTAEFWQYDTRTGRRWNLDPVPQIGISDYAAFGLNPIINVDPNGALFFGFFGSTSEQRQAARRTADETGGEVKNSLSRSIHTDFTTVGPSSVNPGPNEMRGVEVTGVSQYFNPDGSPWYDNAIQAKVNDAWDNWSESEGFVGKASYGLVDDAWVGIQGSPIGRMLGADNVHHLNGEAANNNEIAEQAISAAPIPGAGMVAAGSKSITRAAEIALRTEQAAKWVLGGGKSTTKWASQMAKRGWNAQQIMEAIQSGRSLRATNLVNPGNSATRYIHPTTGRSVVIDNVTNEVLQVGGDGFLWK